MTGAQLAKVEGVAGNVTLGERLIGVDGNTRGKTEGLQEFRLDRILGQRSPACLFLAHMMFVFVSN